MKRTLFAHALNGLLLGFAVSFTACVHAPLFNAPITTEKADFIPHTEEKPMKAYLAMNLPYANYQGLLAELEKQEGLKLKNRGEIHITVITPIEYDNVLKKHLSISEIHRIATENHIQQIAVTPVCLGKGQKELSGKTESTYFVVMNSPGLLALRENIQAAYIKKGGQKEDFHPEAFYPHATLGFTARDLHFEDGVLKDKSSCRYQFKL